MFRREAETKWPCGFLLLGSIHNFRRKEVTGIDKRHGKVVQ
jgi:hypothetical protein